MFDYFKGVISDKRKTSKGTFITIDVSGIGYLLEVTEIDFNCTKVDESEKMQCLYMVFLIKKPEIFSRYFYLYPALVQKWQLHC